MHKGTIVQITDRDHHWFPCLIIVDEVKSWGVKGYITYPVSNDGNPNNSAWIRLSNGEFKEVGEAKLVIPEGKLYVD